MNAPTPRQLHSVIGGCWLPAHGAALDVRSNSLGRIVTDSRQVGPGDVFWALTGTRRDGADFVPEAFARGASGVIVGRAVEVPSQRWAVVVGNAQQALWQWAAWRRRCFGGTVIAVTGSVGKTTTRQMIHTVLASKYKGTASPRNYNNHVGVPLSILGIGPRHQYAVLELAASNRGEIAALTELAAPQIGIITGIGEAHLESFGSRQNIARSKGELLAGLPADGRAVLGDDSWLRHIARGCLTGITWVGGGPECDVQATGVTVEPGRLRFGVDDCPFSVPVWGRHHLTSALAAVAVGRLMGLDTPQIAAALAHFEPVPMRCEVVQRRGATIINDAYNSSPTAMRAALELLRDFDAPGRRIVVFGDMAELGEESARLHRELGKEVFALARADLLIACGRFAREVVAGAREAGMLLSKTIYCVETEQSLPYLGQTIQPGDAVLIKGSRTMEMERIVDALEQFPRRRSA